MIIQLLEQTKMFKNFTALPDQCFAILWKRQSRLYYSNHLALPTSWIPSSNFKKSGNSSHVGCTRFTGVILRLTVAAPKGHSKTTPLQEVECRCEQNCNGDASLDLKSSSFLFLPTLKKTQKGVSQRVMTSAGMFPIFRKILPRETRKIATLT